MIKDTIIIILTVSNFKRPIETLINSALSKSFAICVKSGRTLAQLSLKRFVISKAITFPSFQQSSISFTHPFWSVMHRTKSSASCRCPQKIGTWGRNSLLRILTVIAELANALTRSIAQAGDCKMRSAIYMSRRSRMGVIIIIKYHVDRPPWAWLTQHK